MKIVAVNGSPRKNGNTARMLNEVTGFAKERGAEVRQFDLVDLHIEDCRGCRVCRNQEKCAQDDDMTELREEIKRCDFLLIGSPIYLGAETGLTKCFADRLFALMGPGNGPGSFKSRLTPGKKAEVIFTCGQQDGNVVYNHINVRYYNLLVRNLQFDDVRTFIIGGANPSVDIRGSKQAKEALEESKRFLFG
ncbi:MAG TPA: flavodoxin family protein [Methanomassiliicoccales archaeon]|nr:flavodoxin family protein [Methanomassiliicoccales archaeon]